MNTAEMNPEEAQKSETQPVEATQHAKHPRSPWLSIGPLVAALILAILIYSGIRQRGVAQGRVASVTERAAVATVNVVHPSVGAAAQEVVLPGNTEPFNDTPIYARTNGYLKRWYVDIGAHVQQGQLLAEIDTPEIDQQLDQARADLKAAQANEQLAQITAARWQNLLKTNSVSK